MVGSARERLPIAAPGTIIHFQAGDAGVAAVFGAELPTTRTLAFRLATLFKAAPCAVNIGS
jgi:hypothetical protein